LSSLPNFIAVLLPFMPLPLTLLPPLLLTA